MALSELLHENRAFGDEGRPQWSGNAWSDLLLCDGGPVNPLDLPETPVAEDPIELTYLSQPVEIFPIGWESGDTLHYGWAVLAPELDLDDHPCVSFAPIDGRAAWLGDNTKRALETSSSAEWRTGPAGGRGR